MLVTPEELDQDIIETLKAMPIWILISFNKQRRMYWEDENRITGNKGWVEELSHSVVPKSYIELFEKEKTFVAPIRWERKIVVHPKFSCFNTRENLNENNSK